MAHPLDETSKMAPYKRAMDMARSVAKRKLDNELKHPNVTVSYTWADAKAERGRKAEKRRREKNEEVGVAIRGATLVAKTLSKILLAPGGRQVVRKVVKDSMMYAQKALAPPVKTKKNGYTTGGSFGAEGKFTTGGGYGVGWEHEYPPFSEGRLFEVAPPGMEHVVKALKKKFPGEPERAFKIAWYMHNKKKKNEEINETYFNDKRELELVKTLSANGLNYPSKNHPFHKLSDKEMTKKYDESASKAIEAHERGDMKAAYKHRKDFNTVKAISWVRHYQQTNEAYNQPALDLTRDTKPTTQHRAGGGSRVSLGTTKPVGYGNRAPDLTRNTNPTTRHRSLTTGRIKENEEENMDKKLRDVFGKAQKSEEDLSEKKWIQAAIKHPGALTKSAKKAGESTSEFSREHAKDKGVTGKRARLALTLAKLRKRKK